MTRKPGQGLSKAARDLLAVTTQVLSEQYRAKQDRGLNSEVYSAERKKAARESELELRRQLILSAGIDIAKIEEGQAHDRLALREHAKRQAREAMTAAAEISKRHVVATAERATRLQSLTQFGAQATDYELLKVAASIDASFQGIFKNVPLRKALENVARLTVEMSGSGPFVGPDGVSVNWHFSYVPPRTGLLNVVSSLLSNGFVSMQTDPELLDFSSTEVGIIAKIHVFQPHQARAGVPVHDSSNNVYVLWDHIHTDQFNLLGENRSYPFDDQETLVYNNQFVVIAGLPVDIVIEAFLYVDQTRGFALLDFESSPDYSLNVPFVLAALT
jgi:hypothetical protein